MNTTDKKIEYGEVEIDKDEFDRKNVKIRVTMMVDAVVVDAFRAAAKEQGLGYQTLMNQSLRESALNLDEGLRTRVEALESIVKDLRRGGRVVVEKKRPRNIGIDPRKKRISPDHR